jgi:hypothetical protein
MRSDFALRNLFVSVFKFDFDFNINRWHVSQKSLSLYLYIPDFTIISPK